MGLPFSGGWAEQPKMVVDMIHLLEGIYNEEQAHKMRENKDKPGKPDKAKDSKTFNPLHQG